MGSPRHLMKSYLGLVTLLCSALAISACGPAADEAAPDPAPSTEADVAAIERVVEEVSAAESAGDTARWGAVLTEDFVNMRPDQEYTIGREANMTSVQGTFDEWMLDVTVTMDEVEVAGDLAFAAASYSERVTSRAVVEPGEEPMAFDMYGKQIDILRRQPDGSWKIVRRIVSFSPPPDTAVE